LLAAAVKIATDRRLAGLPTATSADGIRMYKDIIEKLLKASQQDVEGRRPFGSQWHVCKFSPR
jgi:hypothetical protein